MMSFIDQDPSSSELSGPDLVRTGKDMEVHQEEWSEGIEFSGFVECNQRVVDGSKFAIIDSCCEGIYEFNVGESTSLTVFIFF